MNETKMSSIDCIIRVIRRMMRRLQIVGKFCGAHCLNEATTVQNRHGHMSGLSRVDDLIFYR